MHEAPRKCYEKIVFSSFIECSYLGHIARRRSSVTASFFPELANRVPFALEAKIMWCLAVAKAKRTVTQTLIFPLATTSEFDEIRVLCVDFCHAITLHPPAVRGA